jgi:ribosomal protein S18 acetylase RimI-like enzyme
MTKENMQLRDAPARRARPHIAVRPAVEADAHTLAALAIQVWLGTYATEGVNDLLARYVLDAFTPSKFAALTKDADACLLVAEVDSYLVGYALLRFSAIQPLVPEADSELCTLYVQEPFTGAGVGSALLQKARASVRERTGTEALWLLVNVKNRRACGFYAKHGFVEKGLTHFVLGEGRHENHVLALLPSVEA